MRGQTRRSSGRHDPMTQAAEAATAAQPRRVDESLPAVVLVAVTVRVLLAMLFPALRDPGWPDGAILVLAILCGLRLLWKGSNSRARLVVAVTAACFWLAPCLSALVAGQKIPVASAAMAAVAVVMVLGPAGSSLALRTALAAGAGIIAVCLIFGLVGLTGLTDAPFHSLPNYERAVLGVPALQGITLHPNTLGALAAFVLIVGLAIALADLRTGTLLVPAAAAIAVLWSQSRIGIMSAVAGALVLVIARRWTTIRSWFTGGAILLPWLPVVAALLVFPARAATTIVNGRDLAWAPALRIFQENPLTGFGPNVLSRAFWRHQPPQTWEPLHAHNQILQTLAEAGAVGLVFLMGLLLAAVVVALGRPGPAGALAVALLVFVCLQSAVEVPLGLTYFPISYLLPTLCLTVFAYSGVVGRRRPVPSPAPTV